MSEKKNERRGLGRGLSALMADADIAPTTTQSTAESQKPRAPDTHLPIEQVHPNPDQPRRDFVKADLDDLAASIREKGIIQPLLVRIAPSGKGYQIIAGERRWRAAQLANLHEVPVLIRDLNDTEVIEIAIIENIQRADLNAVEEALGYRQLMVRFGHTQEKLAEVLGKSRSHIANLLRLLSLPREVLEFVREGHISAGHARALIGTEDPIAMARKVIAKGLSVRDVEKLARKTDKPKAEKPQKINAQKDADTVALEQDLSAALSMKVAVNHVGGTQSGEVTITYETLDQLDDLCALLSAMPQDASR